MLGFSVICCSVCKDPKGENGFFCFDESSMAFLGGFYKAEGIISMYSYAISISECISQIFSYLSFQ